MPLDRPWREGRCRFPEPSRLTRTRHFLSLTRDPPGGTVRAIVPMECGPRSGQELGREACGPLLRSTLSTLGVQQRGPRSSYFGPPFSLSALHSLLFGLATQVVHSHHERYWQAFVKHCPPDFAQK